jgi:large subunit ribosomal protein L2
MITFYFINKINKKLSRGLKKNGGRNFLGRVCIRGQGGGNKKLYRFIDFFRRINMKGKIINICYDTNRSARLALVLYFNSLCSYILLQKNVKLNSIVYSGTIGLNDEEIKEGYSLPLKFLPLFSNLSNIELRPFSGSVLCRAAEVSCIMIGKIKDKAVLKLNSKWEIHVSLKCIASNGAISYKHINNFYINKAGKNRALGNKPKVRGVAKNPCDHPHGGGRGKKSKPMIPVNAWHSVFKWKHTKKTKNSKLKRRLYKKLNE